MKIRKHLLHLLQVVALGGVLLACTKLGQETAIADGLKVALCVAENQDAPIEVVLVRCAQQNVSREDVEKMLAEQRAATGRAAAKRTGCSPSNQADAGK